MAMLALNVSSDVLNGFSLVDESLNRSTSNSTTQNQSLYDDFSYYMEKNPEKVKAWYDKAQHVKRISDSLYDYVDELKVRIVKESDGKKGDVKNISNKENLEAASYIMLSPRTDRVISFSIVLMNIRKKYVHDNGFTSENDYQR